MREVRRILLTGDAVGGVCRYRLVLAAGLAARGIEPVLALLGPPPSPRQMDEAAAIPMLRVVTTGMALD